jgi:hypothetical protein
MKLLNRFTIYKTTYRNNGRLAIFLYEDGEPYATLTINLSDRLIEDDNIVFINSDVSHELVDQLEDAHVLTQLDVVPYNYGRYIKAYINLDELSKYEEVNLDDSLN